MASTTTIQQGDGSSFDVTLPDEGEIFVQTGSEHLSTPTLYKRVGNDLVIFDWRTLMPKGSNNLENERIARQSFEEQTGIKIDSLPKFNDGDISVAFSKVNPGSKFVAQRNQGGNRIDRLGVDQFRAPVQAGSQPAIPSNIPSTGLPKGFSSVTDPNTGRVTFENNNPAPTPNQGGQGGQGGRRAPAPTGGAPSPFAAAANFTGPSIVDFLNIAGQPSDFASRARLAQERGIVDYQGTAEQNLQLLEMLRGEAQGGGGAAGGGIENDILAALNGGEGQDAALQRIAESNPQLADQIMNSLGFDSTEFGGGVERGTEPPVEEVIEAENALDFYRNRGITIQPEAFSSNPIETIKGMMSEVMSSFGLPDVSKQIEDLSTRLSKLNEEHLDKVASINDNPWISESLRSKRVTQANDRFEARRKGVVEEMSLLQDTYDSARQQAQFAATTAINLYTKERDQYLRELDIYMRQAERQSRSAREDREFALDVAREKRLTGEAATRAESSRFKSVQGGLFDTKTGDFLVEPKTAATTKTISTSDVKNLNLPVELAGKTFGDLQKELQSDAPPDWFKRMIEQERKQNLLPAVLRDLWIDFRSQVNNEFVDGVAGGTSSDDFNFDDF